MAYGDGGGRAANNGGMGGGSSSRGSSSRGSSSSGRGSASPGRSTPGSPNAADGRRGSSMGPSGGSARANTAGPSTSTPGAPNAPGGRRGSDFPGGAAITSDAASFVNGIPAVDTVDPRTRIAANTEAASIIAGVKEGRLAPLPAVAALVRNGLDANTIAKELGGLESEMNLPDGFFAGTAADYARALNSESLAGVTGGFIGDENALMAAIHGDQVGGNPNFSANRASNAAAGYRSQTSNRAYDQTLPNQVAIKREEQTESPNEGGTPTFEDLAGQDQVAATTKQAQDIVDDPSAFMEGMNLRNQTPTLTASDGTVLDPENDRYQMDSGSLNYDPRTAGAAQLAAQAGQGVAQDYDAATSTDRVTQIGQADAATGEVRDEAIIDAPQTDIQGAATGRNEDGSVSYLGQALNATATQNIANVIDTSTVSGKLLADRLGEGNYTDAKATVQGQLEILSEQFTDPAGNPKIPTWAAGTAREVSRIAAFKGMTGTAATAAMSQAIMEASLPIAQQDAQFFQTLTQQNLDNRQQTTINKANVLSRMELANLDARMNAAVTNSKNFMQMDLANLDNEQQTEIINTQARVQSILEDTKAENAARLFTAEAQNDFTKFYDQLNAQIDQFNKSQQNEMRRFNTGEINDASQFNAQLENQREQFYKDMQFNVDMANAKWRQTIETTNAELEFRAAATDVQNMFDISTESLNRIWDRADAALDYAWKSAENEANREAQIAAAELRAQAGDDSGDGIWSAVGSIGGAIAGSIFSDARLKTNITAIGDLESGLTLYEWEWNAKAERLGADAFPPYGVIAQEVMDVLPEAVSVDHSGYYKVDYSKVY